MLSDAHLPGVIYGLKSTVAALVQLRRWSRRALDARAVALFDSTTDAAVLAEPPRSERDILAWLASRGVQVTPGVRAANKDAAVRAAAQFGYPVVLKLDSAEVMHKSRVGGVHLNLVDASAVCCAFDAIMQLELGAARVEGVIVSPMRVCNLELLVAVTRDPVWGPMLTVGLGGVWVEAFADVACLPMPVNQDRVKSALLELKAAPMLSGRGASLEGIADAIIDIAQAARALGPKLLTLEINPLAVCAGRSEAMDALALFAP